MAALLAGARHVLRQGPRLLPAYIIRPRPVPARYLSSSARLFTVIAQEVENSDIKSVSIEAILKEKQDSFMKNQQVPLFHELGSKLRKLRRVTGQELLEGFDHVCKIDKPNSNQAWFFLHACGSLMPGLPTSERTEIANKIWSDLQKMGVVLNVIHYNTLLKVYLENEHPFSPIEFLATMEAAEVEPDQSTYEGLIAAYCSEGDIEGASKILGFMKSKNLPITEQVFNSLIKGHARAGDMESAKNILSVMQDAGVVPRHPTYSALMNAYAENGDIESIKQILDTNGKNLTDRHLMGVVLSLTKSGHSQHAPVIFEHLENGPGYTQELINLCLTLLTGGYEDIALQVAKMVPVGKLYDDRTERQPGNFFLQHCVRLNMPLSQLKKYADEMLASNLHKNPLLFLLHCALKDNKTDLAFELMKTMKEESLPLRTHYFWPLLAHFNNENNIQGVLQTLRLMKDLEVEVDLETFSDYIAKMMSDSTTVDAVLQDSECQQELSKLYMSMLRISLLSGNFKRMCYFLSSTKIPFLKTRSLISCFSVSFVRFRDVDMMAKITGLLFKDESDSQESSRLTAESVGYFLYVLIDSMSHSEVQAMEEHLRQYFHQLTEMGLKIEEKRCKGILNLLESYNIPELIKDVKKMSDSMESTEIITETVADLEKTLENLENANEPIQLVLSKLLRAVCEVKDLEKALLLKSKYEQEFTFAMYMKLLALCCNTNNAEQALKLKQEINQKGFTHTASTNKYRALLEVLTENGFVEDAINILKEMKEKDIRLDKPAAFYYHILDILASRGDVEAVKTVFENIVMLGLVKPTGSLCSPLVMVHLKKENIASAVEAMIECAKKYKCTPLCHEILRVLVEKGETDLLREAVDVLSDLGERVMLHDLFFAFIQTGKYSEAKNIIETPGLRAHLPRISWYMNRFLRANEVELLENCVEMSRNLFGCDREDMYFQLLKLYDKNHDCEKAKSVWYKMREENITPQESTLKFLKLIFEKNDQDISLHIPEFQNEEGVRGFCKTILDYCSSENFYEAFVTFQKAEDLNIQLTKNAYRELTNGLVRAGLLEEAVKVETAAKNHSSNYTKTTACNLLIAEQVRRDCLKDALDTVQMVLENGRNPNRTTLHGLIEALAMNGDVSGLKRLIILLNTHKSALRTRKKHLNNSLIFAHLRNGNFEQAAVQLESLYTSNPEQSQTLYLFQKVIDNNMEEELEKLSILAERLANQFAVYQPVTELFIQYAKSGRTDEARHLLQRCGAIVEQRKLLTYYIGKEITQEKLSTVNHLLELLPDPFYKQVAYGLLMRDYEKNNNVDEAFSLYERMKVENVDPDDLFLKRLAILLKDAGKPVPFTEPPETVQYYREKLQRNQPEDEDEE
ncbi:leucine-rich PPR motif-containing protein, mitochondrial isoform X2 [Pseudophryne corroboree]|uniref:leucine-rich PPR motif-containing protein, mitochondrial isoform X2 n=1 Tax=Pseudophryne corroboree TaxID=495146 RepID=UPI0030814828